ncbi:MAG: hypothetical protein AMJ81_07300 [Phycisphaerae bacterium SM23_33]|jgi:hypothetical protein|nr:MAG: hypothetical protein AMJ81_07300 [Phycisphaerae bacterium SM23_33]
MRAGRVIRRALGVTLVLLLLAALVIYGMICRIPSQYRPRHQTVEQQKDGRAMFVSQIFDFGEKAGKGQPFTWTITAEHANIYLGCLDAIASVSQVEPVHPTAKLERAGFQGPAVAMGDGVLTLMVNVSRYNKIFSLDVAFDFDEQGDLTARLAGVRVGVMPVPQKLVDEKVAEARAALAGQLAEVEKMGDGRIGPLKVRHVAGLLRGVLGMMSGRHVRPEVVWPQGNHRVLIRRVEITRGRLTLHAVPADRFPRSAPSTRQPAGGG